MKYNSCAVRDRSVQRNSQRCSDALQTGLAARQDFNAAKGAEKEIFPWWKTPVRYLLLKSVRDCTSDRSHRQLVGTTGWQQ